MLLHSKTKKVEILGSSPPKDFCQMLLKISSSLYLIQGTRKQGIGKQFPWTQFEEQLKIMNSDKRKYIIYHR